MATDDACKLFVAGLADSISEGVLRELFEATGGRVVDVSLPKDRNTGRPRGFGFVTLSAEAEAVAAREALDGSIQSGRSISVRAFHSEPPKRGEGGVGGGPGAGRGRDGGGGEDSTLYLGNLPYDVTPNELKSVLSEAGLPTAVRVNLPQDAEGRARGFGFVSFESPEAANEALDKMAGLSVKGRAISANVARGRGERGPRPAGAGGGPPGARPPHRDGPPDGPGGPPRGPGGAPPEPRASFEQRRDGGDTARKRKEKEQKRAKNKIKGQGERARLIQEHDAHRNRGRGWGSDDD